MSARAAIRWKPMPLGLQEGSEISLMIMGVNEALVVGPVRDSDEPGCLEADLYEPQSVNINEPGYVPSDCGCMGGS